jgi:ribonuclease Z
MGAVGISPHLAPARGDGATLLLENDLFRIMSVPVRHSIPSVGFIFTEKEREVVDKNKAEAAGLPRQGRVYARLTAGETVNTTEGKVAFDDIKKKIPGRKVVYSGDTEACEELFALAEGADLLIHDCTYFEPPEEGKAYKHATFPEIREMVGRYGIKKTVLTHISRKKSSREQLDDYIKGDGRFVIARDLMTLEL